jgi:hypothetical protein
MKRRFLFDQAGRPNMAIQIDPAKRRFLAKWGGYVRTTARNLIGSTAPAYKGPRAGNGPPRSRTGLLKNMIFFATDAPGVYMDVGPAAVRTRHGDASAPIPALLEYGGTQRVPEAEPDPDDARRSWIRTGHTVTARYQPRPYMNRAVDISIARNMPAKLWAQSIR